MNENITFLHSVVCGNEPNKSMEIYVRSNNDSLIIAIKTYPYTSDDTAGSIPDRVTNESKILQIVCINLERRKTVVLTTASTTHGGKQCIGTMQI